MRTDENNNPTAFTTDIAHEAGLVLGTDYAMGEPFPAPSSLVTARLIRDPVVLTIRVIDAIGFYTAAYSLRWNYISMPDFVWNEMEFTLKRDVIGWMYQQEGGTAMRHLFPNYGKG